MNLFTILKHQIYTILLYCLISKKYTINHDLIYCKTNYYLIEKPILYYDHIRKDENSYRLCTI